VKTYLRGRLVADGGRLVGEPDGSYVAGAGASGT
jgi:hypothetical protein